MLRLSAAAGLSSIGALSHLHPAIAGGFCARFQAPRASAMKNTKWEARRSEWLLRHVRPDPIPTLPWSQNCPPAAGGQKVSYAVGWGPHGVPLGPPQTPKDPSCAFAKPEQSPKRRPREPQYGPKRKQTLLRSGTRSHLALRPSWIHLGGEEETDETNCRSFLRKTIPPDRFSGKTIHHRRRGGGSFLGETIRQDRFSAKRSWWYRFSAVLHPCT